MIPLRDHNPTRRTAVFTIGLIAVNVLVFLTEPLTAGATEQARFFFCRATIPWEVLHGAPIGAPPCPDKNVWLSIVYSMFLHGGLLHIAGNMLFLWVFGNNIEDRLGPARFLILYFVAGIAATYLQSFVSGGMASIEAASRSSLTPMVGASGAVAGVLGAYILLFPRARVTTLLIMLVFITTVEMPAALLLGLWFLLQVFSGVTSIGASASSGVAFFAHVGGFVAGMILLVVLGGYRRSRPSYPDWA